MTYSRREFVSGLAAAPLLTSLSAASVAATTSIAADRFDPWLEIDPAAFASNVQTISKLAGGRPILAVIKNNAYGLGLTTVGPILEQLPQIRGFAVVKTSEAIALRDAGITKPILLLGLFAESDGEELANRDIQFSYCTDDSGARIASAAKAAGKKVSAQIYLDTGMGRMGIPYHRAMPVLETASSLDIDVQGTFMGFTESDFDTEQLARFVNLADAAKQSGINLGTLHAASSHAVFNFSESHLDQVRPGIALFGAYPSDADSESAIASLAPAFRLRARVVRVERLRPGDSVSYGRNYIAKEPTWTATLPVGHTDGMPREAVEGARVLVNGTTYPVIGAVSASHTIIELGPEKSVDIGDIATLVGPDHPAIHPNELASSTGTSVYDVLMHLNPTLPKTLI
jgi:alanine racemase